MLLAAAHLKSLTGYMVSRNVSVVCTAAAEPAASAIAGVFKQKPQVFPDCISEEPEAAFVQYIGPAEEGHRDTVVMVAEDGPVMYWLLRALHMNPQDAAVATSLYRTGHGSYALVNVKSNGSTKVIAMGDTGYLPLTLL